MRYIAVVFWHTFTSPDRTIETRFRGSLDACLDVVFHVPCSDSHWYIFKGDFVCESALIARSAPYFGY